MWVTNNNKIWYSEEEYKILKKENEKLLQEKEELIRKNFELEMKLTH